MESLFQLYYLLLRGLRVHLHSQFSWWWILQKSSQVFFMTLTLRKGHVTQNGLSKEVCMASIQMASGQPIRSLNSSHIENRTSLVVQWIGIFLPMLGTWVRYLVWDAWFGKILHAAEWLIPCAATIEAHLPRACAPQHVKPARHN